MITHPRPSHLFHQAAGAKGCAPEETLKESVSTVVVNSMPAFPSSRLPLVSPVIEPFGFFPTLLPFHNPGPPLNNELIVWRRCEENSGRSVAIDAAMIPNPGSIIELRFLLEE
jgi:hypothetical protein